jgi:glycosyltransferase involved in cell wall biosynthesis
MARLAFCSPVPPEPTGIADYAAEILALLAPRHVIDVVHDQERVAGLPAGCGLLRANELVPRHRRRPYDLVIHQLGNGPAHAFVYPLLAQAPGLLVLHDLVLHHSRAAMLLDTAAVRAYAADPSSVRLRDATLGGRDAYRNEVAYAYPREASRLVAAHEGTVGRLLPYAYPLFHLPVVVSRATAVHNLAMERAIEEEVAGAQVLQLAMPARRVVVGAAEVANVRARAGAGADAFVVGCFGLLTPEKRVETVARAVARAAAAVPSIRLLLVGPVPDTAALSALLAAVGVAERTHVAGRVDMDALPAHMEAADVVAHLRYPTAGETSAALLRVLAQGRPAIVSDVANFGDVPDDAVVRADVADEEGEVTRALLRLAASPRLRERLSSRAAAFVAERHSPARALASYEAAIETAMASPIPRPADVPGHWKV